MNQCTVLLDKGDNAAFLSLRLFPWKPLEQNKSYQSFSQILPWLTDLCFINENCFVHLAMRARTLEHILDYGTHFPILHCVF